VRRDPRITSIEQLPEQPLALIAPEVEHPVVLASGAERLQGHAEDRAKAGVLAARLVDVGEPYTQRNCLRHFPWPPKAKREQ